MEERNTLLLRAARGDGAHLRAELLRRVRPDANGGAERGEGRRMVAELLAAAQARREEGERRAAEEKARDEPTGNARRPSPTRSGWTPWRSARTRPGVRWTR